MHTPMSKEEMDEQYNLAQISTLFEMPMGGVPAYANLSVHPGMSQTHSRSISSESNSSLVEATHPSRTHPSLQTYSPSGTSPNELLPADAPTQRRRYATASSSSVRRDVPPYMTARRRPAQQISDEEDELAEEPLPENATEQEKMDYRRRQNTLAARRSRRRRLLQFQKLEEDVARLTREKDIWRERALMMERLLTTHGLPCPNFDQ